MFIEIIFPILKLHAESYAIAPLLVMGGLTALEGMYKQIKADQAANELDAKPVPEFKETPEMAASRMRANEMAKEGFTGAEQANFDQRMARSQNTAYQHGVDRAPNLSQALLAGTNYTNIAAQNQFAAQDAALHRQNIHYADTFSKTLQNLADMNIQQQLKFRQMAAQSIGKAQQDATNTIFSGINTAGYSAAAGLGGKTDDPNKETTTDIGASKAASTSAQTPNMNGYTPPPTLAEFLKIYQSQMGQPVDFAPYAQHNMLREQ